MRAATIKNNPRPLLDLTEEVAPGILRLTHRGKLVAYVLFASHYDEEDIHTMTDAGFWRMICQRRNEKTIPWEEVEARLLERERKERNGKKANGKKKGKRDATA